MNMRTNDAARITRMQNVYRYTKKALQRAERLFSGSRGSRTPDCYISPKYMILNSSVPCDSLLLQKKVADIEHRKDI